MAIILSDVWLLRYHVRSKTILHVLGLEQHEKKDRSVCWNFKLLAKLPSRNLVPNVLFVFFGGGGGDKAFLYTGICKIYSVGI